MSFIEPKDSNAAIIESIVYLCKIIEAPVTKTSLKNALVEHPNFPSLASISDVLTKFNIGNRAIKTSDLERTRFNLPVVAFTNSPQSSKKFFLVILSLTADNVTYYDPEFRKVREIAYSEFIGYYGGIILEIETNDNTGEPDFQTKRRDEIIQASKKILTASSVVIIFLAKIIEIQFAYPHIAPSYFLFFILAFLNSLICLFILTYEIEGATGIAGRFCNHRGKIDCASVMNSNGAKLFGTSLSIIAATFCFGSYVALLLDNSSSTSYRNLVCTLTLTSVPFVLYSLCYQLFVIKKFCLFCMALISSLSFQVLLLLFGGFYTLKPGQYLRDGEPFTLAAIYISIFSVLSLLIPELVSGRKHKAEGLVHRRFKYNDEIFSLSLAKQRSVANTADMCALTFGSDTPTYIITIVSDPYCSPCATTHATLNKLVAEKSSIQLKMIFYTSSDTAQNIEPVRLLLDSYSRLGKDKAKSIIDSWYESKIKDVNSFSRDFGIHMTSENDGSIQEMRQWCDSVQITKTPTIFINGFELPPLYMAEDLQYILN